MSYLVFKDGLPFFKDGLLQFSATSPPDPDCCDCPTATPLVCCPEAANQSLWCDVSDPCLASAPVEFVPKGSVVRADGSGFGNIAAQEWEGVFCADGTGRGYLRCGGGYLGQSTTLWRLWLVRSTFSQIFGIPPAQGQCTPLAISFTGNIFSNGGTLFCAGCPYGPCTFTFSL